MAETTQQRAAELFKVALEHEPAARAAFLDQQCGNDAPLRHELESLLTADVRAGEFMERSPAFVQSLAAAAPDALVGQMVGAYRIVRQVGSGGMGTVYEAVQERLGRTVALKVVRSGLASPAALRRFEYEAKLLARLRHPAIAQIDEVGTHVDREGILGPAGGSVPFFAMEYVPNAPTVVDYVRKKSLTTRQCLALFAHVCDGVQYGHQRGVIHRDLKPSNILVADELQIADCRLQIEDGSRTPHKSAIRNLQSAIPKIIDFGVARAVDSDQALTSLHTSYGQLVGTLQYMSPEQCGPDSNDIDVRSDIYSLGVVLFELLCGKPPYTLLRMSLQEATRVIREELPPRLSSVDRTLRGDVDTIVRKALEKDRNRRYQSAGELAGDLRHYLADEAIEAKRDSAGYVLRKHLRRYKWQASAAAAFVLLVTGGFITALGLWQRAARAEQSQGRERQRAERALTETEAARAEERTQRENADLERQRAEQEAGRAKAQAAIAGAANKFLAQMLAAADRGQQQGRADLTVREVLDLAAAQLESGEAFRADEFKDVPAEAREQVEGAVRDTIGNTYFALGLYPAAEPHLTRALVIRKRLFGDEHPDVATSRDNLARLLQYQGKLAEAEPVFLEALAIRRKLLGDEHIDVAASLHNLASVLQAQGKLAEAEPLYREALAMARKLLGGEHPVVASGMNSLAALLKDQGKPAEAEPLFREALAMRRKLLGEEHPYIALSLGNLAMVLRVQGKLVEAEPLCRETLALCRKLLGDEHPHVAASLNMLAVVLRDQGNLAEAEPLYREALAMLRKLLGDEHPTVATNLNNLASLLQDQGKLAEAEPLHREALAMRRRLLGHEHPELASSLNNLARVLQAQGKLAEAEPMNREALALLRKLLGDEHPTVATSLNNLASLLQDQGRLAEAESLHREALAIRLKKLPAGHIDVAASHLGLGACLTATHRFGEAEEVLIQTWAAIEANAESPPKLRERTLHDLVKLYESWDSAAPDQGYADKVAQWRAQLPPPDPAPPTDTPHDSHPP